MAEQVDLEARFQPGVFERFVGLLAYSNEASEVSINRPGIFDLGEYQLACARHQQLPGETFVIAVKEGGEYYEKIDWVIEPCRRNGRRINSPLLAVYEGLVRAIRSKRREVEPKDWTNELAVLDLLFQPSNPNYFPTILRSLSRRNRRKASQSEQ